MKRVLLLAGIVGCASHVDGGGGDVPPGSSGWAIDVDMSGLDRFVPLGTTTWPVRGHVKASAAIAEVDVAGMPAQLDAGDFSAMVTTAPGLTLVPIVATDIDAHARQANRSLLEARFAPEGSANPGGASIVFTDAILAAMSSGLAGNVAAVDVAGEILAMPVLSDDGQCATWPTSASQGQVAAHLVRDHAELWLEIVVPQLDVTFDGQCQGPLRQIPLSGEMSGDLQIWTRLTPGAPGAGGCITSFQHTAPQVSVANWAFGVWGTGGPLQDWIVSAFSGDKAQQAQDQLTSQTATRADQILAQQLASISVFDKISPVSLLGRPVDLHLCLGGLDPVGDTVIARIATTAQGMGTRAAPGAPQIDGDAPIAGAGELVLDANVVGQLLFSAWRDGGLARMNAQQVDFGELAAIVRGLGDLYPDATTVDVSFDGELPPLVRATPDVMGADLRVELGDLMLDLSLHGESLFKFGVHLTLDLDLVPMNGALVPMVIATKSQVTLLAEKLDGPDLALEEAVQLQLGTAAAQLLGMTALALPAVPGMGTPTNVTPDANGRYLHVQLD